jgi:aconitate hydratase
MDVRRTLQADGGAVEYYSLAEAEHLGLGDFSRLPYSLKVLAENLLRHRDGETVTEDDIRALGQWSITRTSNAEIAFRPSRIIMPDASGIPLLADLTAMRAALGRLGGQPERLNPLCAIDFIVDHSLIVEASGSDDALRVNMDTEYARNGERFAFLKWAQQAFENIRIVPPGNGIMHQINLEYLARVVWTEPQGQNSDQNPGDNSVQNSGASTLAYPDSVIGMDSHTPMINAMGVLGWGVGGIEAGAAMLGQPISLQIPEVMGCRLHGRLRPGVTATDAVLTVTQALRARGVVQKFVEFCGDGLDSLALTDRATLANMAPEYGATMGFFPIDAETLRYMATTGRDSADIALVEAYARVQGMFREPDGEEPLFTDVVDIDLDSVETSLAGPSRPHQRTVLGAVPQSLADAIYAEQAPVLNLPEGPDTPPGHGAVAIAAITSCTNTSNPAVMLAAGMLARNAVARGLSVKPWVKTSLAPGSRVVDRYLESAGLKPALGALGFHTVGYGCTTCMGASGDIAPQLESLVKESGLVAGAVLSGNRNFEARVHPLCRVNYLASPPLVVAYALAGSLDVNLRTEPVGHDPDGAPVYLSDLWPDNDELEALMTAVVTPAEFKAVYAQAHEGGPRWDQLQDVGGALYHWDAQSTYLLEPPHFDGIERTPRDVDDISGAAVLVSAGDSTTTDHISPVGEIPQTGAAGRYLLEQGVRPADFNNFMTRRGNHEVMVRGTFANVRFRNELADGREGGFTRYPAGGEVVETFDAAVRYRNDGVPLVVMAGKEYGTGSSRDWAAKGTYLLGIRVVMAESFERIHRSNLIGMGVLPLQFPEGTSRHTLDVGRIARIDVTGLRDGLSPGMTVACALHYLDGTTRNVTMAARLDTPTEVNYYRHGGMLHYALRTMLEY